MSTHDSVAKLSALSRVADANRDPSSSTRTVLPTHGKRTQPQCDDPSSEPTTHRLVKLPVPRRKPKVDFVSCSLPNRPNRDYCRWAGMSAPIYVPSTICNIAGRQSGSHSQLEPIEPRHKAE